MSWVKLREQLKPFYPGTPGQNDVLCAELAAVFGRYSMGKTFAKVRGSGRLVPTLLSQSNAREVCAPAALLRCFTEFMHSQKHHIFCTHAPCVKETCARITSAENAIVGIVHFVDKCLRSQRARRKSERGKLDVERYGQCVSAVRQTMPCLPIGFN